MKQQRLKFIIITICIGFIGSLQARKIYHNGPGIVGIAKQFLGTPYQYGGVAPTGFDCSGFTGYVYKKSGYRLPRGVQDQYNKMYPVRVPKVGDLIFFNVSGQVSHVGLYVGNYTFIHAPSTGKTVSYANLRKKYWKQRYVGARSIFRQDH